MVSGAHADADARLVVRRTFLQIEHAAVPHCGSRNRSFSDTSAVRGQDGTRSPTSSRNGYSTPDSRSSCGATTPTRSGCRSPSAGSESVDGDSASLSNCSSGRRAPLERVVSAEQQHVTPIQPMLPVMMPWPLMMPVHDEHSLQALEAMAAALDSAAARARSEARLARVAAARAAEVAKTSVNEDERTTVMLRGLPAGFTRDMLVQMLDSMGFRGLYDFVYLPLDFKRAAGWGNAFVNLCTHESAKSLMTHLKGFDRWPVPSKSACTTSWCDPDQGLHAHVQRVRDSPVLHPGVPDHFKPLLFSQGVRVAFPPPTKKLRAPRMARKAARTAVAQGD